MLGACESKPGPLDAAALPVPTGSPAGLFAGVDSFAYVLPRATVTGGCYLLAPERGEPFATVFYRPAAAQAWQEVGSFPNVQALDTANIDGRDRAELLVTSEVQAYGTGGGTACQTLTIYQCEATARKVFEAPIRYVDEWYGHDEPNSRHYYESTQAVQARYGALWVGRPRSSKALRCNGYDLCIGCTPKLKPGRYALRRDTVAWVAP
ncbi:hypothetical protein ACFST9_25560 [Hymenobacter monticola]|uniref:Lipoprotein n=1 Tax=Hymenobacter monticola TaxID=1705399 RepID=A0ABY4BDD0_9BACT|nr:hypothetical protein [Hymenobacter monticola]UOE34660.1 hypothetical protein MTP16_03175 [Hymenobacter monticola]